MSRNTWCWYFFFCLKPITFIFKASFFLFQYKIRGLTLCVLRDILHNQPAQFKDYAELTILKILESHKDPIREVSFNSFLILLHFESCNKRVLFKELFVSSIYKSVLKGSWLNLNTLKNVSTLLYIFGFSMHDQTYLYIYIVQDTYWRLTQFCSSEHQ